MIRRDNQRSRSGRRTPRRWMILAAVGLLAAFLLLRFLAVFWTDFLWFASVDATSVWSTRLLSQLWLGAAGTIAAAVLVWVNLWVAYRISSRFSLYDASPGEELIVRFREWVEPRVRWLHIGAAGVLGLLLGAGVSGWWRDVLLFMNQTSFGKADPIFGRDASFYVFQLPVYRNIVAWLLQIVILCTVLSLVLHYLYGGIRMRQSRIPQFGAGVKAHLSVLLAGLALIKAVAYQFDVAELVYSSRGAVFGASYTDVTAHRPALILLSLISVFAAGLLLWNIRARGWTLPAVAAGLWLVVSLVVGGLVPLAIERFRVQPNQFNLEKEYIEYHIDFTREAYGMGEGRVEVRDFAASPDLTAADIAANQPTIDNVRLWDPGVLAPAYRQLQAIRPYYQISNVDTDRYVIDGQLTQVMVAARELDSAGLPATGWVNERLVYTHGFGEVISRANDVNPTTGEPAFLVRDVPPAAGVPELETEQPRIYFGESFDTGSYVIVGTNQQEVDFPSGQNDDVVRNTYEGEGGVRLSNFAVEAAMAMRFGDLNILISPELNSRSKILMVRDVTDRLAMVAPFLYADYDPYLALIDGRLVWIADLYSVTDRYPYSQPSVDDRLGRTAPLPRNFNYIRNSVKAVVDAEDGTMDLYVLEGVDALTRAYRKVFPEVFRDASEMSDELRSHLRYPEDLFRVQSDMYAVYHQSDPEVFFQEEDKWEIPGESATSAREVVRGDIISLAGTVDGSSRQSLPYYLLMRLPGEEDLSFLVLQSFNPAGRANMTAFMVAKSDPGSYGEIIDYRLPRGELINGLEQISARIDQDPEISQQFTLLGQQGSVIIRGNLLVVPVEESLLFIQPIYLRGEGLELPEFKRVVVVFGEETPPIMRGTLEEALAVIFGEDAVPDPDAEVAEPDQPAQPDPPDEPSAPAPDVPDDLNALVAEIDRLLSEADQALRSGDLGAYQSKVDEARALANRLTALIG